MADFAPEFQQSKLDELVLYISERNLTSEWFGRSKLHKLLWMSRLSLLRPDRRHPHRSQVYATPNTVPSANSLTLR